MEISELKLMDAVDKVCMECHYGSDDVCKDCPLRKTMLEIAREEGKTK